MQSSLHPFSLSKTGLSVLINHRLRAIMGISFQNRSRLYQNLTAHTHTPCKRIVVLCLGFLEASSADILSKVPFAVITCHAFLQGIFPTRDRTRISYVSCIGFFTTSITAEAHNVSTAPLFFPTLEHILSFFFWLQNHCRW